MRDLITQAKVEELQTARVIAFINLEAWGMLTSLGVGLRCKLLVEQEHFMHEVFDKLGIRLLGCLVANSRDKFKHEQTRIVRLQTQACLREYKAQLLIDLWVVED